MGEKIVNPDIINDLESSTLKSVVISERVYSFNFASALNAHSGSSLTGLGGTALTPNAPTGYTFVGNVNIVLNGLIGVQATFDGDQSVSQSVNPYIFNGSTSNLASGTGCTVRMYSLCCKK